jgi:hypothetical protein
MNACNKIISISSLRSGDVLLCCGEDRIAQKIANKTNSRYTHAAICINSTEAVEAGLAGVEKDAIANILGRYQFIAVFRQPDAWNPEYVKAMNLFVAKILKTQLKYNLAGILHFLESKKTHHMSLQDKIEAYFEGYYMPDSPIKQTYFCSELVADCFIVTGFISPSAAVIYKSSTYSPGDLGRDPTFGTFVGYILANSNSAIPDDDEFIHKPTFAEIYGDPHAHHEKCQL